MPTNRYSTSSKLLWGLSATATLLLSSSQSFAFCRTKTCEFTSLTKNGAPTAANEDSCERDPVTLCSISSQDTFWNAQCLALSIHEQGSVAQGISAQTLDSVMQLAVAQWQNVQCGGQTVFRGYIRGITSCGELQYNCESDSSDQNPGYGNNENIVVFRDGESLLGFKQIALTTITANLSTGEILDADIEINSRDHEFHVGDAPNTSSNNLLVVLTHEVGHFLGLSHSLVPGSLMGMFGQQQANLGEDDVTGFCQIWGEQAASSCEPPSSSPESCAGSFTDCVIASPLSIEDAGCTCSLPGASRASRSFGSAAVAGDDNSPWQHPSTAFWLFGAFALLLRMRPFKPRTNSPPLKCRHHRPR